MKTRQKLIYAFTAVSVLLFTVGLFALIQLQKVSRPLKEEIPSIVERITRTSHLDSLAQFIRYYDEVLTQSARNYAFTQNIKWKLRYKNTEPKLDRMIKQAAEKGDDTDKKHFSKINKANIKLVEMEHRVLELVDSGRVIEAVVILEGDDYRRQKELYEQGLRKYVQRRGAEYDAALKASTKAIDWASSRAQSLIETSIFLVAVFVVVAAVLSAVIGISVSFSVSRALKRSKNNTAKILRKIRPANAKKIAPTPADAELKAEIARLAQTKSALHSRIKELNCLYSLSKQIEQPDISLEQIFLKAAALIRNTYQEPEKTCVRITFNGIHYKTDNFKKTELSQHTRINVRQGKTGDIEVYYLGERPSPANDIFIKEESELLEAVARRLGEAAEHIQAAEKLQLFRDLLDRSNDSIFVIEPKWGRFLDVNDRACNSLGYSQKELLDMTVKDIDQTIGSDSAWTKYSEQARSKGNITTEGIHKRKDGNTITVEVNTRFMNFEKSSYMIAVARDITERKKAEEEIHKLSVAVKQSPASIVITDTDGNITYVNPRFTQLTGYSFEEAKGQNPHILKSGEKPPEEYKQLWQTITSGKEWRGEFHNKKKNGQLYWELASISPITNPQGQITHFLAVKEDITELKLAEVKQARLLEQVESINKELKDFAYIVSHDLKAPLRGIKSLVDWITTDYSDKLDDDGKEQMQLLVSRVDRMRNLIDGILRYSRVGIVQEERVAVDLNGLVPEVVDMVSPPENIEITIEGPLPVVECEKTRIQQVFQNLISNAVKYMDKPQGRIRIGCTQEDAFWKFSVCDNGPGIEKEHFEKIFKIFQTLAARDQFESTGVGLSVVKKVVEIYGGRIWVESEFGQGSTFFFTLPKQTTPAKDIKVETGAVA